MLTLKHARIKQRAKVTTAEIFPYLFEEFESQSCQVIHH